MPQKKRPYWGRNFLNLLANIVNPCYYNMAVYLTLSYDRVKVQEEVKRMLNKYESIYIVKPEVEEQGIKELVEKFNALIETAGGKVSEVQEWGLKRLAYPIQKKEQGYYVLVNFEANPESIVELERVYKITDSVMKFITVRKDEE